MKITTAAPVNLPYVLELLKLVNLPIEGVKEHFSNFFVLKVENRVIGSIGVEIYPKVGLLRSLAIHPNYQRRGLGY